MISRFSWLMLVFLAGCATPLSTLQTARTTPKGKFEAYGGSPKKTWRTSSGLPLRTAYFPRPQSPRQVCASVSWTTGMLGSRTRVRALNWRAQAHLL